MCRVAGITFAREGLGDGSGSFMFMTPDTPRICVIAAVLSVTTAMASAQTPGPGVPAITWDAEDLFKNVGTFGSGLHGMAFMHDGYLVIPTEGRSQLGGFRFYDITDPTAPVLFKSALHEDIFEAQAVGHFHDDTGRYAVISAKQGIQFWDLTDVSDPQPLKTLLLPDATHNSGDYNFPVWWVFWQAPYVYAGGGLAGLFIVDATDPADPQLINRLSLGELGGFRMAPVELVGNLMVIGGLDVPGVAVFDVGDPANPTLLSMVRQEPVYSIRVNGDRVYVASAGAPSDHLIAYDISQPTQIVRRGEMYLGDRGGYITVQDQFVFTGASQEGLFKIDASDVDQLQLVGGAPASGDSDYASVIGNMVAIGDDDGGGTRMVAHQAAPDTTPPIVNMVNPSNNAANQPTTSRVGLTFTDQIDLRTVNNTTFIVRPVGGDTITGRYSGQSGVVNFAPDEPLTLSETYEVFVHAGGIKDYGGNEIDTPFMSRFVVGEPAILDCELQPTEETLVGEEVTFTALCGDTGDQTFAWNFGDGTPTTPFSTSTSVTHTFDRPGAFIVFFIANDNDGLRVLKTTHRVRVPPTPTPPTHSTSILYDANLNRVWNVNPDNNTVTASDADTLGKILEVPVGRDPTTLALDRLGRIWVTNRDDATITMLDATSGQVIRTIPLPRASQPYGIVAPPTGDYLFLTLEALGLVGRLNLSTGVISAVAAVPTPRGIALTHDGLRVFVTRFVSPRNHGEVAELSISPFNVVRTFTLVADPGPDTDSSGRGVPNYLQSVTITPCGQQVWVTAKKDNTGRGTFLDSQPLTFESTVRNMVAMIDLQAGAEIPTTRRDLNNSSLASSVTFTADGDFAFITTLASNLVQVLDAVSGEPVGAIEDVGIAPRGSVLNADNSRLFVHNFLSREVAVFDVSNVGNDGVLPKIGAISTVANEKLSPDVLFGKQIFYNAADTRMARDKYLSCATCHLDGGSDHRVWDFTDRGEGLRNTPTLRGRGGMRHGPVHWSANFDEIQDFEHDIRGAFGGTGFMDDADFNQGTRNTPLGDPKAGVSPELDALAAYLRSLNRIPPSPFRDGAGNLTFSAQAGKKLFESSTLRCTECHRGSRLTDSDLHASPFILHDIGSVRESSGGRLGGELTGIDTPTLAGLWATAPYLHDGSADTVYAALTAPAGVNTHGRVSGLDSAERAQLSAYLLQIEQTPAPDLDRDEDVDQEDFAMFQLCITGEDQGPPAVGCQVADFDDDGDVDEFDLDLFEACAKGPNVRADIDCMP